MLDPRAYWVGFNHVKGIGPTRLRALLGHFGDAETAWKASANELLATGLGVKLVESILSARSRISLEQVWGELQANGVGVLIWDDENYPRRLKEIDQPPPVLYLRGDITSTDEWAVAVVGTRRVTPYGRQITEEVSSALAGSGVTVVSGLARGIDSLSHKSALEAGGRTIAVLGSGVDVIYPPEHGPLAERIVANGALVSDYPPGTQPDAVNFPPRNRIISGLSLAVVIVEAGEKSGALITGEFAADQGRDVYAVPGHIHAPQSIGCNRLIQQGARPLLDPKEILEALDLTMIYEHRSARRALPANSTESQLMEVVEHEPQHVDEIIARMNLPVEQVTAALALMELKGMVKQVGGMRYVAVREIPTGYVQTGPDGDH